MQLTGCPTMFARTSSRLFAGLRGASAAFVQPSRVAFSPVRAMSSGPLTVLTEEEEMIKETGALLATRRFHGSFP